MFGRKKIAMVVAEFLGTFTLAGAMLSMVGRTGFPFFVASMAGVTMGLMTLVIGAVSGAQLNPAITLGLWTVRKVQTTTAAVYIIAQVLAGLAAWSFNEYLLASPLKNMTGEKFVLRMLIAEAVGTMVFAFGYASAVYQNYQGLRRAVTIGASLTLGILLATFASNGVLNPAVAIGIRSWSYVYAAGPVLGAIVGINLYARLFAPVLAGATISAKTRTKTVTRPAKKR